MAEYLNIPSELQAFLQAQLALPFSWGRADCVTFVCDWAREATGRDPLAPWRGKYRSGPGAVEFLGRYGGLLGALDHGMGLAGIDRCAAPEAGDIGLILLGRPVCAIRLDGKWIARRRNGFLMQPADAQAVWSMGPFHG